MLKISAVTPQTIENVNFVLLIIQNIKKKINNEKDSTFSHFVKEILKQVIREYT